MKKPLLKNILLELMFVLSAVGAWTAAFLLAWEAPITDALFCISVLFMIITLVHAVFADKWWNIPCIVYIISVLATVTVHFINPELYIDIFEYLTVFTVLQFMGLDYMFAYEGEAFHIIVILFSALSLGFMLFKYLPEKKIQ